MNKSRRLQLMAGTVAVSIIALGCSTNDGGVSPYEGDLANGIVVDLPGNGVWNFEELEVCKQWTDHGSVPTTIDVTVADPGMAGTTTSYTLASGECRVVAQFDGAVFGPADLSTTEVVPAGATLDSIVVVAGDRSSGSSVVTTTVLTGTDTWSFANANNDQGFLVTYHNSFPPPPGGGEGCTPGYWKQSHHFDSWPSSYAPGDDYDTVFGVSSSFGGTLLDALKRGGGKEKALGRHAVAALLNAGSGVDYAFTEAGVIQMVQDAYSSGDFNGVKDELATENERGCPLN